MVKTASQQTSGSKLFKDWREETVWAQCDKVQSNKARCHPTSKLITPCLHAAVMMKAAAAGFNQLLSGVNLRWNYSNKVRDSPHASGRKSLALRGEMVCVGPSCRSSQCDRLHFGSAAESGGRRAVLRHISRLCSYPGCGSQKCTSHHRNWLLPALWWPSRLPRKNFLTLVSKVFWKSTIQRLPVAVISSLG